MTGLGTTDSATEPTCDPAGSTPVAAPIVDKTSRPQNGREFEQALRGLGYSKREARGIAVHGFKAVDKGFDELNIEMLSDVKSLLEKNLHLLKETQS